MGHTKKIYEKNKLPQWGADTFSLLFILDVAT